MRVCGIAGGTGQTAKVLTFYCTRLTLHSFIQLAIIQAFVLIHCVALGSSLSIQHVFDLLERPQPPEPHPRPFHRAKGGAALYHTFALHHQAST
jgi:hypothetical protein